jgi:hypothetical protein
MVLIDFIKSGIVSKEVALLYATNPNDLKVALGEDASVSEKNEVELDI